MVGTEVRTIARGSLVILGITIFIGRQQSRAWWKALSRPGGRTQAVTLMIPPSTTRQTDVSWEKLLVEVEVELTAELLA